MPATTASRVIAAAQVDVWAALSDIANAGRWNATWSRIEITSQRTHGEGARFRAHTRDGETFDFEVTGWIAPEYVAFSPIRDDSEQYGITLESHAFNLVVLDDGKTRLDLTAIASTHGIRGRLMGMLFWRGYQRQGLDMALDAIQALVEGGRTEGEDTEVETTLLADG